MITRIFLICTFLLATPLAIAYDISGFWKHPDAPAWIEISMEEGKGTVVRNDKFPECVGREFLKDIQADNSEKNLWHAQIWAEKLGEYKEAEISLPEPDRISHRR